MSQRRIELGKYGEELACQELERRGYAILARRFRVRGGELDIVARDGSTLVFVEVKARDGTLFGTAAEAVTWEKQRRLSRLAQEYLIRQRLPNVPCRFDVVTVRMHNGCPSVEIIRNAFDLVA